MDTAQTVLTQGAATQQTQTIAQSATWITAIIAGAAVIVVLVLLMGRK